MNAKEILICFKYKCPMNAKEMLIFCHLFKVQVPHEC